MADRRRTKTVAAILSRKRSLYSTRRLVESAKRHGVRPVVLDTLRCSLVVSPAPRMVYRGVEVRGIGAVIPRIGASITSYGLAVVAHLEAMKIPVLNPAGAIAVSRDKLRCLQVLASHGIDIPRTLLTQDRGAIPRLVEELGGLPVIIKLLRGTQGVGVMLASTLQELRTTVDTFWQLGQEVVVQEFIAESRGRDIRALVVGDRVVGAMVRRAKKGEFRSNLHRGGSGRPLELPEAYADVALRAARIVGLDIAGVDLLESRSGPKVMEINSSPGFEGLERATGQDIAGAMIEHALASGRRGRRATMRGRQR